ncbi:FAD-dependent oxidoreductase [Gloeobacter morelensis]|uniref:FAD-binding oxidoreductase n=1 Tax=Gloeobacter morelensis MG652769 TaxID=2781736 RepID=A0ABY3PS41_9CYAN|nr:FAD-dependent oxidoreductase [Gloeobacter morelensis]UFP96551.1 FAD-binding oxidoreductase [Gloeobacter morelensis MG652769]
MGKATRPLAMVLGAGVSGLTTAYLLQRCGIDVLLVAEQFGRRTTSVVAGALWEWQPAVCGFYEAPPKAVLQREKRWSIASYERFLQLLGERAAGVYLRRVTFYLDTPAADNPFEWQKMVEMRPHVHGFCHDAALIDENGVNPAMGFVDAYAYLAPMIDTDMYMGWLLGEVLCGGAVLKPERLESCSPQQLCEFARNHGADVLFNCTGLGALELTGDELIPVRGAWYLVRNDGTDFAAIREAHCTALQSAAGGGEFIFIVPRGGDRLILGGIAQPYQWQKEIDEQSTPALGHMLEQCRLFMPALGQAKIHEASELRVGLRPFRRRGARVELESGAVPLIHNYGHGGSGVTLSWGAADEAVQLAQQALGLSAAAVAV